MKSEKIKKLSTESKQFRVIRESNLMLRNYVRMDTFRLGVILALIVAANYLLSGFSYFVFCMFVIMVNGIVFSQIVDDALDVHREKMLEIMEES